MKQDTPDIFILEESMRVFGDFSDKVKKNRGRLKSAIFYTLLGISIPIAWKGGDVIEFIDRNYVKTKVSQTLSASSLDNIVTPKAVGTFAMGTASSIPGGGKNIFIPAEKLYDDYVTQIAFDGLFSPDPHIRDFFWQVMFK